MIELEPRQLPSRTSWRPGPDHDRRARSHHRRRPLVSGPRGPTAHPFPVPTTPAARRPRHTRPQRPGAPGEQPHRRPRPPPAGPRCSLRPPHPRGNGWCRPAGPPPALPDPARRDRMPSQTGRHRRTARPRRRRGLDPCQLGQRPWPRRLWSRLGGRGPRRTGAGHRLHVMPQHQLRGRRGPHRPRPPAPPCPGLRHRPHPGHHCTRPHPELELLRPQPRRPPPGLDRGLPAGTRVRSLRGRGPCATQPTRRISTARHR